MAITTLISLLVAALAECDEEGCIGGPVVGYRALKRNPALGEKLSNADYFDSSSYRSYVRGLVVPCFGRLSIFAMVLGVILKYSLLRNEIHIM